MESIQCWNNNIPLSNDSPNTDVIAVIRLKTERENLSNALLLENDPVKIQMYQDRISIVDNKIWFFQQQVCKNSANWQTLETKEEPIPFSILWGSIKRRVLKLYNGFNTKEEDEIRQLFQIPVITRDSSNGNIYHVKLNFRGITETVDFQYENNFLILSHGFNRSPLIAIQRERREEYYRYHNEPHGDSNSISVTLGDITLVLGNFR